MSGGVPDSLSTRQGISAISTPSSDNIYEQRVNALESLYAFHPDYVVRVSPEQREILSRFYFFGRPVDVESVQDYRAELVQNDPGIEQWADEAWRALCAAIGMTP
jgi:hypothetical protein